VTVTLLNKPIAHHCAAAARSGSGASSWHDCRDSALFDACWAGATRRPTAINAAIAANADNAQAV
jgi:hypothetical protein